MLRKSDLFHVKQGQGKRLICIVTSFILASCSSAWAETEKGCSLPSWGAGKCEVYIFSDYFCPPCQKLEVVLEPLLYELLSQNRIKLFFIDLPLYRLTPLYNEYFLRATKAERRFERVFAVRKLLFELASRLGALAAKHLEREFRSHQIALQDIDARALQEEIHRQANHYGIRTTPAVVIKCPGKPFSIVTGGEEILNALRSLLS